MLDRGAFEERAAIAEYCGGLTRFHAETLAAKEQGMSRHEALNAIRMGHPAGAQHQRSAGNWNAAGHLSAVQSGEKEQDRPMPVRDVHGRGGSVVLPSLRLEGGR